MKVVTRCYEKDSGVDVVESLVLNTSHDTDRDWQKLFQSVLKHLHQPATLILAMHLMYTIDETGNRVYTLKVRFVTLILATPNS